MGVGISGHRRERSRGFGRHGSRGGSGRSRVVTVAATVTTVAAGATVAAVASAAFAAFVLGVGVGLFAGGEFALTDPAFDADLSVERVRLVETVVNVGAERVQRESCRRG